MFSRLFHLVKHTPLRELPERLNRSFRHRILHQPDAMLLQVVSACNLRCKHCFLTDYGTVIPDGQIKVIPFDEVQVRLEKLRPLIKQVRALMFSSFEALLHKDIFRMMDAALAINPKLSFPILTNGQLVTPEIVARLENYRLSCVTISLDGLKPETVEAFKTGAKFEKTINAIQLFCKSKHQNLVNVVFVAHRKNIRELPDYMDFVASLGVKDVQVSNLLTFREDLQSECLYGSEDTAWVEGIFAEAQKRAQINGQILGLPGLKPKPLGCTQSETVMIDIDGNITPCDFLAVHTPFYFQGKRREVRPLRFGNVFKANNPLAIWYSKDAKEFRAMHRQGEIPAPCSHCIDAYGLMCSRRDVK